MMNTEETPDHPFDRAIALEALGEGRWVARTQAAYANMIGPFGGATAAALMQSVLRDPRRIGIPVAFTVNFASPLADGAYEVGTSLMRTNRTTQHWSVGATQSGAVVATGTAVFAMRRQTWSRPEAQPPSSFVPFDRLPRAPGVRRAPWVDRYDMRYLTGGLPSVWDGTEAADATSCVWLRDDPPRQLDHASLTALCDAFMPRIYVRRRLAVPIGTVTMTTYFHADDDMLAAQGDRPVLGVARASSFRNGYFDQSAEVWSADRQLLASTCQLVYYRE